MQEMKKLLNKFAEDNKGIDLSIKDIMAKRNVFDITKLFTKPPANIVNGTGNTIAYCMTYKTSLPLVKKYKLENGRLIPTHNEDGKLTGFEKAHTDNLKVACCLCLKHMKSTTLYEIYEPLKNYMPNKILQGYLNRDVQRIVKYLKNNVTFGSENFDPDKHSAIIFAGNEEKLISRMMLYAKWLNQIVNFGSKVIDMPLEEEERRIILEIFPEELIKNKNNYEFLMKNAYVTGNERKTTVAESAKFLQIKLMKL